MRTRPTSRVTLRPATDADHDFLARVYASTRTEELAATPWSDAEVEAFLRMQFDAQDRHYRLSFPDAERSVVEVGGRPAGRLYVHRSGREIRIVDIALLPEFRGDGVGTAILRDLLEEASAAGLPVRIHVETFNSAMSLYRRLGFTTVEEEGVYVLMERPA